MMKINIKIIAAFAAVAAIIFGGALYWVGDKEGGQHIACGGAMALFILYFL